MSLYIHIPFCAAKCAYCDFYSGPLRADHGHYVDALRREWMMRRDEIGSPVKTIYVGGGTPSLLNPDVVARFADWLPTGPDVSEFTVEMNPDDVTPQLVEAWQRLGCNRISMGVQSLVDTELKAVGRRHTSAQVGEAYKVIRQCGVGNVSLDLIYGLPGQTPDTWLQSLDGVLDMAPEHLSAYMLSYEPGTRLTAALNAGHIEACPDDVLVAMYEALCQRTRQAGFEHYEISNFAKPGYRARHNSAYWDFSPYVGLGPGAHSFDGSVRRYNPSNLRQWLADIDSGRTAYLTDDETDTDRLNDRIMVVLRTSHGLELASLPTAARDAVMSAARPFVENGTLVNTAGRLFIPERAFLLSDAIIRELLI